MKLLQRLFESSLGKKYVMAVTGFVLFGFVCGHMVGNLQFFLGAEAINRYAHFLQSNKELLYPVRLFMLAMVGLHIWSAVRLTLENRAARPMTYEGAKFPGASYASRTMIWSGLIIAAFVVFHLLHYTVKAQAVTLLGKDIGGFQYELHGTMVPDVFKMMVLGFSQPLVSVFYIVAVWLICLHLGHGVGAMFQSLGIKTKEWGELINRFGLIAGYALAIGYTTIPVGVLLGFGKEALK